MSTLTLADEISDDTLLVDGPIQILIDTGSGKRIATLRDLRDAIREHGLEITTKDAVDWGTDYPQEAEYATRICQLTRLIADIQHARGEPVVSPLPVPIEKKEAAE